MKAMSRFFLIVSGILLLAGIVLMIIGGIMAKNAGIQLYQKKVDGKYLYSLDLTDKEITKISIDATDADIIVHTGAEKDYIDFTNFNENYYSIATTNRVVKFEEYVNLSTLISFWDGNFTFKGMRSFFNFGSGAVGQKQIDIYLHDTKMINVFSFTISDGDITIENANSSTDYLITMDSGNVLMSNVVTDSSVSVNGNKCVLRFDNCSFKYFDSDIANIDMTAAISDVHKFEFNGKSGTLNVNLALDAADTDVVITSSLPFTFNSQGYTGEYKNNEKMIEPPEEYAIVHIDASEVSVSAVVNTPEKVSEE